MKKYNWLDGRRKLRKENGFLTTLAGPPVNAGSASATSAVRVTTVAAVAPKILIKIKLRN